MLKKFFNIITQKDLDNAESAYNSTLKAMKDSYNRSLSEVTKSYNSSLSVLKDSVSTMNKEIDSLHEDVAMALNNEKLPKRGIVIVASPDLIDSPIIDDQITYQTTREIQLAKIGEKNRSAKMLAKLEAKVKSLRADQTGRGGINVLDSDGQVTELSFGSTEDLKNILKRAKAGEIVILEQDGL